MMLTVGRNRKSVPSKRDTDPSFLCCHDRSARKIRRAVPTGFEPAISALTGQRVKPLHYGTHKETEYTTLLDLASTIPVTQISQPAKLAPKHILQNLQ